MNSLTIAYVTSRHDPKLTWFLDSLAKQAELLWPMPMTVIIVDGNSFGTENTNFHAFRNLPNVRCVVTGPKPTIWQGPHQITSADWWAKSNALNTAICLCETDWIAFVDDRSVLMPGWLDCIYEAMRSNVAVVGNYEKRSGLKVVDGVISDPGTTLGSDNRTQHDQPYFTRDWYGGSGALPIEWCLAVNGFSEDLCDGLGSEDSMFGVTLRNSDFPIMYDPRMLIIEDRTPGEIDGALKRADKGVSPNDKSHRIVEIMRDKTTSQNSYDIRNMRDRVLAGEPFPPPSASHLDWFDGQPIKDMT